MFDEESLVIETDEESAESSLNRVSGGDIDRGYASPDQTYQSEHHDNPGAYQRSEEISAREDLASYY